MQAFIDDVQNVWSILRDMLIDFFDFEGPLSKSIRLTFEEAYNEFCRYETELHKLSYCKQT